MAFPLGATGPSHVPPSCESVVKVTVEAVQGNQVHLGGMKHLEVFWHGGTTPGVSLEFLVETTSP